MDIENIKEIDLKSLKILQMDILDAIDDFCSFYKIRYSIACGTLLGAIRHKGYIPWDDDIDIYIPRKDYQRLISLFPDTYKGCYKIASLERDREWEHAYAKAYDARTLVIENALVNKMVGVNIDIFPIDDVPDNDKEWNDYNKKRLFLQNLYRLKGTKYNKKISIWKNVIRFLVQLLTIWYSLRDFAIKLDGLSQKYNDLGYKRCFECCQGVIQKKPFPKTLFDDIITLPFEDRKYKAFANYDLYLRCGFGDYMKLPPIEKRVVHHDFKAYWK